MSKFTANCVQRSRFRIPILLLKRMYIQNTTPEGRKDILQIHRKKKTSNNAKAAGSIIWIQ